MRFVVDTTAWRLGRWLSLLGYDVVHDHRSARRLLADPELRREGRIILGRCPSLVDDPRAAGRFVHLTSEDLDARLRQVVQAFPIDFRGHLFTRCRHCNRELEGPLTLEDVGDRVPPRVRDLCTRFHRCPSCGRVYWQGTHTESIRRRLRERVGLDV